MSRSTAPLAVSCRGLKKHFGDVRAVDGLDLEIRPGECFGLLGPNGAGKTTTIEILEGLTPPDSGDVEILGRRWGRNDRELRGRLGISLQESRLTEKLTVYETLSLFRSFYARGRSPERLMADLSLEEKRDARVGKLSGGQRQRLAVACALAGDPELLFLDEPTTGLDPQSRNALWGEVGRLAKEEGVTVFLTTQYLEEADVLADRVGIIDHGHIVAEGTPAALKAEIARPTVEIVPSDPEQRDRFAETLRRFGELVQLSPNSVSVRCAHDEYDLAEIIRALDAEGLHATNLQLHAPSLDDVFLEKTGRTLEGATAEADAEAEAEVEVTRA